MADVDGPAHRHGHSEVAGGDSHDHLPGDHAHAAHEAEPVHGAHHDGPGHVHGRLSDTSGPGALRVLWVGGAGLAAVAAIELTVAVLSSSAAVLADGLHNLGDVLTTAALAVAFTLSRRAPSRRFPYGYHRAEDLAGLVVVLLIVASAVASAVTSVEHLLHRQQLTMPAWALVSALVGFAGNEAVARYKEVQGRRLRSASLVADGRHSRVDGLASLGAAVGVVGAWAGASILDPLAGLVLSAVIAAVAWDTARNVTARLLDEADASLLATIEEVAAATPGVVSVGSTRTRWIGRRVLAELVLCVPGDESVARAHALGEEVRHALYHRVEALAGVVVHLDPAGDADAHSALRHHEPG